MSLCASCAREHMAWLDYNPPASLFIHVIGNDRGKVRWGSRIIETIREQLQLIRRDCAAQHSDVNDEKGPQGGVPVQLAMFDLFNEEAA